MVTCTVNRAVPVLLLYFADPLQLSEVGVLSQPTSLSSFPDDLL